MITACQSWECVLAQRIESGYRLPGLDEASEHSMPAAHFSGCSGLKRVMSDRFIGAFP